MLEVTMFSRDRDAFLEALKQSDLKLRSRVFYRFAYLSPKVRSSVVEYISAMVEDTGSDVSTMAFEDLIKFILDNLPEIIAFIEMLIKLFA